MNKNKSKDPDIQTQLQAKLNALKTKIKKNAENKGSVLEETKPDDYFWFGPPVSPKIFIEDKQYFNNKEKKVVYPWVIEVMEDIFSDIYHLPKYNTAVILAGKGSGKSYLAAMINCYLWYLLLSFKSFSKFLREVKNVSFDDSETVHIIGMAKTGRQAKDIVFDKTSKIIHQIDMFYERNWLPDPNVKSELKYVVEYENDVKFPKVAIFPGNSSDTFALGFCIFGGVIDEAAFWKEINKDPVKDVYEELHRRRYSRFGNNGIISLISSADAEGDFIEQLFAKSATDPSIYAIRKPVYECKPELIMLPRFELRVKKESLSGEIEEITIHPPEIMKKQYELNLYKTLKDVDAIPALAGTPFYPDFALVLDKVNKDRADPCPDEGKNKVESPIDVQTKLQPSFTGIGGCKYRIHIDLAKGNIIDGLCGCGFAMTHKIADPGFGFKIKLDLSVRFKSASGGEIKIADILNFIKWLKNDRGFDTDMVTFDQYQSMSPIQTINDWKIGMTAQVLAVGKNEHAYLKNLMLTGQLDFYYDQNLFFELKRLEDYGTTVIPTSGSYKDEADAVAGSVVSAGTLTAITEEKPLPRVARGVVIPRNYMGGNPKVPGSYYRNDSSIPRYRRNLP